MKYTRKVLGDNEKRRIKITFPHPVKSVSFYDDGHSNLKYDTVSFVLETH